MSRKTSAVVKIKPQDHAKLSEIAREDDRSMGDVISDLLVRYETERFWTGVKSDLEKWETNPVAMASYDAEITAWDSTTGDGIEDEEPYYTEESGE